MWFKVPILVNGTKAYRGLAVCFLLLTVDYSLLTQPLCGFDRTNVPLKNWGGFAVNRSWIYDALDKIVLAGLADQVLLNTKPLSRVEAARVVAQAVRRIKTDQSGDYNHRGYLEELVYQLVEEFGSELGEMGVRTPLNRGEVPKYFHMKPVHHMQFSTVFASDPKQTINNFGRNLSDGRNFNTTFDGKLQIGDFLSFYYQPEFSWDKDTTHGRLLSGYGKLTFWNVELLAGMDSMWWGPGFNGASMISNNARPFPMIKLSSAEPFRLPWLLRLLGPTKVVTFLGQLEEDRDFPHAKLGGFRASIAPFPWLESGMSVLYQFGGRGRPSPRFSDIPTILSGKGDIGARGGGGGGVQNRLNNNGLLAYDVTVRIPNVNRILPFPFAEDLEMYVDYGSDDMSFRFGFLPLPDMEEVALVAGVYLSNLFRWSKTDLRFEIGRISEETYVHHIYRDGLTFEGRVIGHHSGTDSRNLFLRLTRWLTDKVYLGFDVQATTRGIELQATDEKRFQLGLDLSYRGFKRISTFFRYQLEKVDNVDFNAGDSDTNHFFQLEATFQF